MRIEIDQEIIDLTKECKNNFACLNGDTDVLDKVDYSSGEKILFVKLDCVKNGCFYYLPFRNSYFCWCPTRTKIYEQYLL